MGDEQVYTILENIDTSNKEPDLTINIFFIHYSKLESRKNTMIKLQQTMSNIVKKNNNWAVDGWVSNSSSENQNAQFWASLGFNEFGLILSNNQNNELSTALGYSIERKFTDEISLGTGLKLVEFSNNETRYLGGWDAYIVLSI